MAKLRIRKKHREALELGLNITSLMDVLTVLLFFLLKSFSVAADAMTPPGDIKLPNYSAKGKIEETVVVALTKNAILVNGSPVAKRSPAGTFSVGDLGTDQRTVLPLKRALDKELAKRNAVFDSQVDPSQIPPGRVLFQADRNIPFSTLKYLLHTASNAGYSDYQFVVENPDAED